jgi:hypothetical protein
VKKRVGRNDPCPCGSGRKFKVCCAVVSHEENVGNRESARPGEVGSTGSADGRFRFEAGSYGSPGGYFPSIACLKRDGHGGWAHHFVLVVPDALCEDEETATLQSGEHLFKAFGGRPAPEALALRLKNVGYVSISDFRVIGTGSHGGQAFRSGVDGHD